MFHSDFTRADAVVEPAAKERPMAQPATSDSNVLTTLDDKVPTAFYWQLTLLATLGGFLFGYDTSNIGSALNFVPYHLHGLALGYLVSGASLGAAAGREPSLAARSRTISAARNCWSWTRASTPSARSCPR